jgi:hypothetical protein
MNESGPPLELLVRRLAETPLDFFGQPALGEKPGVHTAAVVNDVLRRHGATALDPRLHELEAGRGRHEANRSRLAALAAWLLADDSLVALKRDPVAVLAAILETSGELASLVPASKVAENPERREEFARLVLARLSLRPAGETEPFARDRLTSLSAAERARVLSASRAAEQRARAIREALVKKAAEESADKWSRE